MANARQIVSVLKGRWVGNAGSCRCPAHEDHSPSLSVREADNGNILVHCFGGCPQAAVIDALKRCGLWPENGSPPLSRTAQRMSFERKLNEDETRRSAIALAVWQSSKSGPGTLVETYFASRGLDLLASRALRFHAGLKHPSGGVWPAMVALVTDGASGSPIAIHRTFLARDGSGKAPVDPQKMMLGPCHGGVVRLADPGEVLMVGEGIETCLAAMQATRNPAWAALSTSGLRALNLPRDVRDVIVLADGDEPGEAAAQDCARRWKRERRRVRIARPPMGMDFNDLLTARMPSFPEGAR